MTVLLIPLCHHDWSFPRAKFRRGQDFQKSSAKTREPMSSSWGYFSPCQRWQSGVCTRDMRPVHLMHWPQLFQVAQVAARETKGLSSGPAEAGQPGPTYIHSPRPRLRWTAQSPPGHVGRAYRLHIPLPNGRRQRGRGCESHQMGTAWTAPSLGACSQPCLQTSCQTRSQKNRTRGSPRHGKFATAWLPLHSQAKYLGQLIKRGSPVPSIHTYWKWAHDTANPFTHTHVHKHTKSPCRHTRPQNARTAWSEMVTCKGSRSQELTAEPPDSTLSPEMSLVMLCYQALLASQKIRLDPFSTSYQGQRKKIKSYHSCYSCKHQRRCLSRWKKEQSSVRRKKKSVVARLDRIAWHLETF